ncbi:YqaE/Pmp3 family membrane protein [Vibrio parahaemolyticus]|nr:YqaE/Pmp3 family membrane protein [Vibrio parahaemolyticus]NEU19629.1 YqaE/Pmp3 family membrane protein [Vibrio parahaemolyticus]
MRLLLVIFLHWLPFFTISRPFAGMFCLTLQLTLIGWRTLFLFTAHH